MQACSTLMLRMRGMHIHTHTLQTQSRHASHIQGPSGMMCEVRTAMSCGPAVKHSLITFLCDWSYPTFHSPRCQWLFYAQPLCFHDAGQGSGAGEGDSPLMHLFDVLSLRPPNILCPTCHLG